MVNYWLEPVDPSLKVEEYTTMESLEPEFVLEISESLPTFSQPKEEENDTAKILLWVGFTLALIIIATMLIIYLRMQNRRKKM